MMDFFKQTKQKHYNNNQLFFCFKYVVNKNTASPTTQITGKAKLKLTEETKDTNLFCAKEECDVLNKIDKNKRTLLLFLILIFEVFITHGIKDLYCYSNQLYLHNPQRFKPICNWLCFANKWLDLEEIRKTKKV